MQYSPDFYRSIINSLSDNIVVIDREGKIQYVNASWVKFGFKNDCSIEGDWLGINYLETSDAAARMGDIDAREASEGIRKVMQKKLKSFCLEYPCHSRAKRRWFMMTVAPMNNGDSQFFVIAHKNITKRKLVEEKATRLAGIDCLTGLASREYFNDFLGKEWRRCARLKQPISLVMLDVDNFSLFNDNYGHPAGDECLKKIGGIINSFTRRPGDLSARFGGEEIAVIMGNTDSKNTEEIARTMLHLIQQLAIPHAQSAAHPVVTASIGIATAFPSKSGDTRILIEAADRALISAKDNGRNKVVAETI